MASFFLKGFLSSTSSSSNTTTSAPPSSSSSSSTTIPTPPPSSSASSGCPFGFTSSSAAEDDHHQDEEEEATPRRTTTATTPLTPSLFGRKRVVHLYEQYIHLPPLREVWESPMTERPELEPCFSAACHGMEIGFLLLTHFLVDSRTYVQKRSRVELVMEDLVRQCSLLSELVDGELEEHPSSAAVTTAAAAAAAAATPTTTTTSTPTSNPISSSCSTSSSFSLTDKEDNYTTIPSPSFSTSPSTTSPILPLTRHPSSSLTQDFPFPGCPPTTSFAARSPALELLIEALQKLCMQTDTHTRTDKTTHTQMTASERVSVKKVVRNITNAIEGAFREWSVGLGIEGQLNELREVVGLPRLLSFDTRQRHLDYALLVRPEVVAQTYTHSHAYTHAEDFFFRSVHLGTDCWSFVCCRRLESARALAEGGEWHNAAARVRQAAHILSYLGEHVMMLTSMVLCDYLRLKVEIEGTSGEGSQLVKQFRGLVKGLFVPLKEALLSLPLSTEGEGEKKGMRGDAEGGKRQGEEEAGVNINLIPSSPTDTHAHKEEEEVNMNDDPLHQALLQVYEDPGSYPGIYNYIKSLECVESALLGGFYFHHYRLAVNVIGADAKGTMNRAVKALKKTYETDTFEVLNTIRSTLGTRMDAKLGHVKGKIMTDIEEKHAAAQQAAAAVTAVGLRE